MPPFYGVYKCRMPLRAKVDLLQRNLDDLRRNMQTAQNLP